MNSGVAQNANSWRISSVNNGVWHGKSIKQINERNAVYQTGRRSGVYEIVMYRKMTGKRYESLERHRHGGAAYKM